MSTLITGGTGKTGAILAKLLHAANRPFVIATRSGKAPEPFKAVTFDWFNPATFENPFKLTDIPNIDRVYLILPPVLDSIPLVSPFIDLAISKGVKRFVLLTSTQSVAGGPAHGKVHQYLLEKGVDYAVLKPSWFIRKLPPHLTTCASWDTEHPTRYAENFLTTHYTSIRENNQIQSATGDGKIPWISSEDIAQAAFEALTADKSPNREYYVLGPELRSYDEVNPVYSPSSSKFSSI